MQPVASCANRNMRPISSFSVIHPHAFIHMQSSTCNPQTPCSPTVRPVYVLCVCSRHSMQDLLHWPYGAQGKNVNGRTQLHVKKPLIEVILGGRVIVYAMEDSSTVCHTRLTPMITVCCQRVRPKKVTWMRNGAPCLFDNGCSNAHGPCIR